MKQQAVKRKSIILFIHYYFQYKTEHKTTMTKIHKLLSASVRFGSDDFSSDVLNFLVETVTAAVEDEIEMDEDECMTMLLGKNKSNYEC